MAYKNEKLIVTMERNGKRTTMNTPIVGRRSIVIVINNQFTNSPNTTQIASGAGRSSASGSNVAIGASNTLQQQSVGAKGRAKNTGMNGRQSEPHQKHGSRPSHEEITIVINNQINHTGQKTSSATQIASGGGKDSASGTNAAIESSNTKQQHAVGGDKSGRAVNRGMKSDQIETSRQFRGRSNAKPVMF